MHVSLKVWVLTALFIALTGCGPSESEPFGSNGPELAETPAIANDNYDPAKDYFSYANTRQFRLQHLVLDLRVDFEQQKLQGTAQLQFERLDPSARELILDSRGLLVESVALQQGDLPAQELSFVMGASDPVLGEPVTVTLPGEGAATAAEFTLLVRYATGENPSAIMWLDAATTAGGEHPFMFTQSQAIHARSWVPLQDSPSVRFTYQARIHTPPELLAVMSANNDPQAIPGGEHHFSMPQPIPSYLLALAVGKLSFEPFGERTGVYAEPEILSAAAWEFADTEDMLEAAEAIYGPYEWGRYDLLVLPPSFPYGGMENPRLSFITPSVLAGDRSLVSLIAHELAHSWSGNLVSNATWRDIWLNEGTTSYLEARLMEVLFGKERADEERVLSYLGLLEKLQTVPAEMQGLAPRFDQGDPDVGQDGLEYAKGQLLLETLEARFGREVFDPFLAGYFRHFAWQAITTEQFLDYVDERLLQANPGIFSRAELEQWLYQPGIPENAQVPSSRGLDEIDRLARAWAVQEIASANLPAADWSPQGTVRFLEALPASLSEQQLAELDAALVLSESGNAEIGRSWFIQVAKRRHLPAYPAMEAFLARHGRARLVKPVYEALAQNGQDGELARSLFEQNQSKYHPQTADAIRPVLGQ